MYGAWSTLRSNRQGRRRALTALLLASLLAMLLPVAPAAAKGGGGLASIDLSKSVAATTLTPALALTLGVDKATAIPGDTLTYTAPSSTAGRRSH